MAPFFMTVEFPVTGFCSQSSGLVLTTPFSVMSPLTLRKAIVETAAKNEDVEFEVAFAALKSANDHQASENKSKINNYIPFRLQTEGLLISKSVSSS